METNKLHELIEKELEELREMFVQCESPKHFEMLCKAIQAKKDLYKIDLMSKSLQGK